MTIVIIKCDKCGKIVHEGKSVYQPSFISVNRGSDLMVGGGYNTKSWDLCKECFEVIRCMIEDYKTLEPLAPGQYEIGSAIGSIMPDDYDEKELPKFKDIIGLYADEDSVEVVK